MLVPVPLLCLKVIGKMAAHERASPKSLDTSMLNKLLSFDRKGRRAAVGGRCRCLKNVTGRGTNRLFTATL